MTAAELVYRHGDRIRGWGRFVEDDEGRWLDVTRLEDWTPRNGAPPRHRWLSVRVEGAVDTAAVPTRSATPGVVAGHVTLTGVWDGLALHVEEQSPVRPPESEPATPTWSVPPCPEPPGGWPHGMNSERPDNLRFDVGDLLSTGAAVTVVTFRPGPDQAVLVVAATDADRVRAVLGPQLPDRLCVVPSRFTRAQLDEVRASIRLNLREWTVGLLGGHVDDRAQESVRAHLLRVPADLAQWADTLVPGLLTLHPALVPV